LAYYPCEVCGKSVRRYPSDLLGRGRSGRVFCGRECQADWQRRSSINTGENNPRWKNNRISVTCEVCKKDFAIIPAQFKRFTRRFCSRTCKGKWFSINKQRENSPTWKGISIERPCDACGKMFRPRSESAERRSQRQHWFCSRTCRGVWMSKHQVAEQHPNWRGGEIDYYGPNWKAQQKAARVRDGHKCCYCKTKKGQRGKSLDVHHIRPFRDFGYVYGENDSYLQANDLVNLITLCPKCHKAAEAHKIAIQPYLL
jgi:5-methylcytosine-specific restriction endonuclease McrA